ncbi:hypothetical protein CAMGR0001_0891 [Campylobacter gracilis RM3268]|uniref:Uncharacterized protein n=1 Tax=Campylobacter gracilis RM3268 TaxID=553220 RepID=C8PG98_9BACT|nr:hypothetical protein CAMGR0001_0891 [Campylobacter gracilis RM3268]
MLIFSKASKLYSRNSKSSWHCGADSCAIRAKLSANETSKNLKKAAKGAGVKDRILLNLEHILHRPVRFIRPLRAQLACKTAPAARNL